MDSIFNPPSLQKLARQHRQAYRSNTPFPHIVLDDFLPMHVVERILAAFPTPGQEQWEQFDGDHEVKLQLSNEYALDPYVRQMIYEFNSSTFIEFLESLTDIDGLIPDPHMVGGGLHQILPGGYLDVHVDFNYHTRLKLDRRLNLLLYLNKDWRDEYNGCLELWDVGMTQCVRKIAPVFNRCVIFSTTDFSYHGHPEVLACPPGTSRKSLALYYYSNGRPAEERSAEHSTIFRNRPGESPRQKSSRVRRTKRVLRRFVPPILIDALNAVRTFRR